MAHSLSKNKILLIVEGKKTEPNLFKRIGEEKINKDNVELSIIDIRTNIYALYCKICNLDKDFFAGASSTLDVLRDILIDEGRSAEALQLATEKFPYVYLLFDFEYQDNHFDSQTKEQILKQMMNHFSDETENGLLLINYPMVESYKDYKEPLPYDRYKELYVLVEDVLDRKYKQIVDKRGTSKHMRDLTYEDIELIFVQNLCKANYIVNNKYEMPTYDTFQELVSGYTLLDKQLSNIGNGFIYVVCTCMFIFTYYYGKEYYERIIEKHSEKIIA